MIQFLFMHMPLHFSHFHMQFNDSIRFLAVIDERLNS